MATPSIFTKHVVSYTSDVGGATQTLNDDTEKEYQVTDGYELGQVIVLATGTTNQALTISGDAAIVTLEEITGDGFKIRVGAADATQMFVRRFTIEAPKVTDAAIADAVVLYLTNDGVNEVQVKKIIGNKVT